MYIKHSKEYDIKRVELLFEMLDSSLAVITVLIALLALLYEM